jgi:hypothetical protein
VLLGLAGVILAQALGAQSPIGDPFLGPPIDANLQDWQAQTFLADGDLLVVWMDSPTFEDPAPISFRGRRFSLHHSPGEVMTLARGLITDNNLSNQLVAPRADGGFLLTFNRDDSDRKSDACRAIAFDTNGNPLTGEVEFARGGCGEGLVALADGTFATSWTEVINFDSSHPPLYMKFARLSPLGEIISRPRRINPRPRDGSFGLGHTFPLLSGNAAGDMTLVWDGNPSKARSFNAYGGTLPPLFFVHFTSFSGTSAAVLPNGNRIFVGQNERPNSDNYIVYQRFAPDGTPLDKIRLAHTPRHAIYGSPSVAADRFGNFVIAWGSQPSIFCDRLEARLFRADGTPVGKEFFASLVNRCEGRPKVSFGNDGIFALTWVDFAGVNVAWYSASPADEPCLTRGGHIVCDTGRTGGPPEIDQAIDQPGAPPAADALFLADGDGDGRADPCYRSGTTFVCELGHRGRGPRTSVRFGEPSDLPLMGDVDGDGRAEACVRRGDLLACDTGHDGGAAEFEERFGNPNDIALLGDLNGDRRDDLCLFRDGVFSCDLAHDGGAPDRTIRFGKTGDLPALGDFDGDGRDDPCLLRGRTLRCDTKHDGGTAESILRLDVQPGDGILMGNLDGL